ncbi:MAG: hypothetical protein JKY55_19900 [Aliivibrio sp.]|uniref:hypothetical protein n=1 Tax=Aliivibrio sp. TaxID=1872443 RepID=UPI001A3A4287|nr:hypothetical protein [Aliivibrio sp.]
MNSILNSLAGPNGLILFGALISTIGVIWSSVQQNDVNKNLTLQSETIISQSLELGLKAKKIEDKNEVIIRKSDELLDKGRIIEDLNIEILNHTTGGDSFPELTFINLDNQRNIATLGVYNSSEKYNVLDVEMRISDIDDKTVKTLQSMFAKENTIKQALVKTKTTSLLSQISFGNGDSKKYNVFTFTRNNDFTQKIRLKKIDGKWLKATQITSKNEVIMEHIDEGFPRNKEGGIDWS